MEQQEIFSNLFPSIDEIAELDADGIAEVLESIKAYYIQIDHPLRGHLNDMIMLFKIDPSEAEVETYESAAIGFSNMWVTFLGHDELGIEAKLPKELQLQANVFLNQMREVFSQLYAFKFVSKKESRFSKMANQLRKMISQKES